MSQNAFSNHPDESFIELVKYASKAPSGHNSQPWKFELSSDTITIWPDLDFALPVVDGNHRELLISLGCATENLCVAATHFGYNYQVVDRDRKRIIVRLEKTDTGREDPLFKQIDKRQTNRSIYKDKIIEEKLEMIRNVVPEPDVHFYFAEMGTPFADILTRYIIRGNTIQMKDKVFKKELLSWIRFNKKHIEKTGNGLTYQVLGFPALPEFISRPIVKFFMEIGIQGNSDLKKIKSSSHLVVFTTGNNTPEEWIDLGRTMQRFLLTATQAGIVHAYMNQPCEVEFLAKEIQGLLPINNEYPSIILRIGVSDPMPFSPRKGVESIILKTCV